MNKTIILIPHFNNFKGLVKTISSINSNENVDVLIVDDGSNKQLLNEEELKKYSKFNGEFFFKYLEQNSGIEIALNQGLDFINKLKKHSYIARIDCGDVCLGMRFAIQEDFLTNNNSVVLVGSNAVAVDINGKELYKTKFPEKHLEIKKKMYKNAMFLHPCVMFRISVLNDIGYYPTKYEAAEDYAYFFNILKKYETYNLQQFLINYEINPNGISISKRKKQVKNRIKIIKDNFYFGFWPMYGLIRNYVLLSIPNGLILKLKKIKNEFNKTN